MKNLLAEISNCQICAHQLVEHGVRPVVSAHAKSKIVIIGQAPGLLVHQSGIPWDDKSGENLRNWLNIDHATFYDPQQIAIVPMGFCYPGKGKSGDLPPRKECAPQWHPSLLKKMKHVQLTLLIGKYAQDHYLPDEDSKLNLTERVKKFKQYLPEYFVLPHPSPRNNIWQAKNPWFKNEVIPVLQEKIQRIID